MADIDAGAAPTRIDTRDATPWTTYIVAFLAPAAIIYTLFSIYPLIDTIRLSLYAADASGDTHFVGLRQFHRRCSPTRTGRDRSGTRSATIWSSSRCT